MSSLRFLDSRPLRLLLAAGTGVILTAVFAERAIYTTSIEAVVNAPRVDVVAPFDGVIDSVAVSLGKAVAEQGLVARLSRDAWSSDAQEGLGVRRALLRERVDIIARQLATLLTLQDELTTRSGQYRQTQIVRLEAELTAADAQLRERRFALAQAESLRVIDGVSVSDVERLRVEVALADARVTQRRAAIASARRGVVVDESGQDAPYSQQRLDQLTIDIARLRAERDELKAELAALSVGTGRDVEPVVARDPARPRQAQRLELAGGSAALHAPSPGVVWTPPLAAGSRVLKGQMVVSLVDCRHVYLEATVSPRAADAMRVGQAALVRFAGQTNDHRATVQSIRGGGLRPETSSAAQLVTPNRDGDSHVILALDAAALAPSADNFCQVGRQAKVVFAEEAPWRPLTRVRRWIGS